MNFPEYFKGLNIDGVELFNEHLSIITINIISIDIDD